MSNLPDGCTEADVDRAMGGGENENVECDVMLDMAHVEDCGLIVQSFQAELKALVSQYGKKKAAPKFHESKKFRMVMLADCHAGIQAGKVRAIVGEAIDAWYEDDTDFDDMLISDFGAAMFDRLYGDLNEGKYDDCYGED